MKRFHYKCSGCKKHFRIIWRRSTFERPGLVKCFKCDNLKLSFKAIWEAALPANHTVFRNYSFDLIKVTKISKSAIENNLYTDQWPSRAKAELDGWRKWTKLGIGKK